MILLETNSLTICNTTCLERISHELKNLVVIHDNNVHTTSILDKLSIQNKTFILNKHFIHREMLRIHLQNNHYSHIVYLVSLSSNFASVKDEISAYLNFGQFEECGFEASIILINETCMNNVNCLMREISLNLKTNTIELIHSDGDTLFVINAYSSNQIQIVFDTLIEFIYSSNSTNDAILHYSDLDFIMFNQEKFNQSTPTIKCKLFTSSFLNKSHYMKYPRSIYYVLKYDDNYELFCSQCTNCSKKVN